MLRKEIFDGEQLGPNTRPFLNYNKFSKVVHTFGRFAIPVKKGDRIYVDDESGFKAVVKDGGKKK